MYKFQMTLQRITSFLLLGAAALVFVYSLGVMTDVYNSFYLLSSYDPIWDSFLYVEGADVYLKMQGFNQQLTTAGIILILSAVSLFLFNSHNRRKYYVANYITIGINAILNVAVVVWMHIEVLIYKAQYLQVDPARVQEVAKILNMDITMSTFWFDVHYIVFAAVILATVLSLVNLGLKIALMIGERKLLKEGGQ